jgi:hypothetical protein
MITLFRTRSARYFSRRFQAICIVAICLVAMHKAAANTAYFVSSSSGSDNCDGLSSSCPFRSLSKISELYLLPGTSIYLKAGDVWNEQLTIHGNGTAGAGCIITTYDYGFAANAKILRNSDQSDIGIHFDDPNYWTVDSIDFERAYRGIDVVFTTTGNSTFSVRYCNFRNSPYVDWSDGAWPTDAGTGVSVLANNVQPSAATPYAINGLSISDCTFTNMGQAIGLNNYNPNTKLLNVVISDCLIEDGKFIQLANTGTDYGVIARVKVWNNGVYIPYGPANAAVYGSTNMLILDSEFAYDRVEGSAIDGDGFDMSTNTNIVFRRVLFHHHDAVAIVNNGLPASNFRFEDCVFAADEVNDPAQGDVYGEIRLHQPMSAVFSACRFLPRAGLADVAGQTQEVSFSNTTTMDVANETRGPNLMYNPGTTSAQDTPNRTWEWYFSSPITVNEAIVGEVPGAGTTRFLIQYWDALSHTWKDAYSGNTIGSSLYDRILPFPAKTTTGLRVKMISNTSGWTIGLNQFEAYYVKGPEYQPFPNSDFEAGSFSGWTRNGSAFPYSIPRTNLHGSMDPWHTDWWGDSYAGGESATGTLTSSTFELKSGLKVSVAGWDGPQLQNNNFIYVRRASDNAVLFFTHAPQTDQWTPIEWDTSQYYGTTVYVQLVDGNSADSYAWIALDDLRVIE